RHTRCYRDWSSDVCSSDLLHSTRHTQDELFVNWNAGDYHLSATSPALNIGVASLNSKSAPASDLESHARPQGTGYDIGAYETVEIGRASCRERGEIMGHKR